MKSQTVAAMVFLTLAFALGLAACKENQKASEACKTESASESCDKCCHANGASGYKFMSGACSCLGGGE